MSNPRWDGYATLILILANLFVVFVIQKAGLKDKRYFLLIMLSLADALQPFVVTFLIVFVEELQTRPLTFEILNSLFHTFGAMSYIITILLTLDRFLAICYCLEYYRIVTKKRIVLVISILYAMIGFLVFAMNRWTGIYKQNSAVKSTYGVLTMKLILRFLTVIIVLTVGHIISTIRKENIRKLKSRRHQLFGRELEMVTRLRDLKQSIKDVTVLNTWTVVFVTPQVLVGLIMLLYTTRIRIVEIVFRVLYLISNPIIYLTSQTELRECLRGFFTCAKRQCKQRRQNRVHPTTESSL